MDFRLVSIDREIAIIKHKHGIPFADSLVASTAKIPCCSGDPHFDSIDGLSVKWIK